MKEYRCRRCEREQDASYEEREFGRVVCPFCGGTCDPTPKEQRRLDTVRSGAREQRIREVRYSVGFGTNQAVNRPGLPMETSDGR